MSAELGVGGLTIISGLTVYPVAEGLGSPHSLTSLLSTTSLSDGFTVFIPKFEIHRSLAWQFIIVIIF